MQIRILNVGVGFTVFAEALAKEDPTRGFDESNPCCGDFLV